MLIILKYLLMDGQLAATPTLGYGFEWRIKIAKAELGEVKPY